MPQITRLKLAIQMHWDGTFASLAHRCSINPSDLSQWAGGRRPITPSSRALIANVLHLTPRELDGWVVGDEAWKSLNGDST